MDKFKIEKNIPIPPKGGGDSIYPFDEMEVGDSFFVPFVFEADDRRGKNNLTVTVRNRCSTYARSMNKKFTVRRMENGVRAWRVK